MTDLGTKAEQALRMVREAKDIAYDTETTGLDWRYHSPVGHVVAARSVEGVHSVYVPLRHGGGGNLPGCPPMKSPTEGFVQHPFEVELAKAFEDRNRLGLGRTIGHNMKFDVHMAMNAGIRLGRNLACTANMAAMLNEYRRSFSLDVCAQEAGVTHKLGEPMYEEISRTLQVPNKKDSMEHFWRMPGNNPVVLDYTEGDGISTLELYEWQYQQLEDEDMSVVRDLENDLIWTVFRAERRGILVDTEYVAQLREATERRINGLMRGLPLGFNVRSPVQMKKLFDDAGITDYPTTDLGNPSFTEKFLKKHTLGKTIIEIRQARNLIASFVDPLIERHVFKGRVHATLNQLKSDDSGTISGRFSCSEPNLQQVPKRIKELAKPFRRLFIADEGYVFWERDYSQCEPRLFAHYAQDPNLLEGYNATPFRDAHQVTADLLGVERDPTAKRMNMGIFTGMQIDSFANHMGWEREKAAQAFYKWFENYKSIKQFQNNAKARLKNRGYVFTLLGRRCRLESPRFAYRGTSKIIQGSNADIVKYKFLEVDRICEDNGDIVQVLMTVHDSFNGQFQDTPEARALFKHIEGVFQDVQGPPFNLSVPFVMDGHEGSNWSEATFGA